MATTRSKWDLGLPQKPDGFAQWGQSVSDDVDAILPIKFQAGPVPIGGAIRDHVVDNHGGFRLPDNTVAGISFARAYASPTFPTARITWGYVPITNVTTGNIRWRVRCYRTNVIDGASLISDTFDEEAVFTKATGAFKTMGHVYLVGPAGEFAASGFPVQNAGAFLGCVVNFTIERVGNDALDTYNGGDILLTNASADRD
jgi:hypothetical protein